MILLNDFKREPRELHDDMLLAVESVLASGWYVLGPQVACFENLWAAECGAEYGVGVASGLDAIEIALRSVGIGPGDEVITTPITAFATVLAIIRAGATPVLADIEADTALLSIESVERTLSIRTKAIVLVHLYGQARNLDKWVSLCEKYSLLLIEDCAQAHCASWQGKVVGSFGEVGAFSFYPTKNLGAIGDAGMLVTNDETVRTRAAELRNYGQTERYHHPRLGLNSRLDEVQAALLLVRAAWLPQFTRRRREIAIAYYEGIRNKAVTLLARPKEEGAHVYHLFVVTCDSRRELDEHLFANQVQTLIHYPVPIHHQEPCLNLKRDPLGLTVSERHAKICLSLPCHPQLTDDEVKMVISAVNCFGS